MFENERQENIKCVNTICDHQGNSSFEACCDSETGNGDPTHSVCALYLPERLTANTLESATTGTQHTQPAKCRDCYHWAVATSARCVRGGGDQCVIKGGTQQASA